MSGATKRVGFFHLLLVLCISLKLAAPAFSGTFTCYGPKLYQRGTGNPFPVITTFTAPGSSSSYTLKIFNGGRDGTQTGARVSTAVIILNGAAIVGPQSLNENVAEVDFPVKLLQSNTLSVELRSKPGSLLVLEIVGEDDSPPVLTFTAPKGLVVMDGYTPQEAAVDYADAVSGVDPTSLKITVDGVDLSSCQIGPSSASCVLPSLAKGVHTAAAEIQDKAGNWAGASLNFEVDNKPVAKAGPDQTLFVGNTAYLDGSSSSDIDGDLLSFHWNFVSRPDGSIATLSDPTAVKPFFVIDKQGTFELALVVNDGLVDSVPANVIISTKNSKPVADAGPDQTVPLGAQVFLDGRRSHDIDGDLLSYRWRMVSKPQNSTTTLQQPTTFEPSFIADAPGSYTIELIVNDGSLDSDPSQVVISTDNSRPVANAGPDQQASVGTLVQLDGSGSKDADNDPLTYQWSFTSVPQPSAATLSDPKIVNPTFVPDLPGLYVVQLIVSDGRWIACRIRQASPSSCLRRPTAIP